MGISVCIFYFSASSPHHILPYKSPTERNRWSIPHIRDREKDTKQPAHRHSATKLSQNPIHLTIRLAFPVPPKSQGLSITPSQPQVYLSRSEPLLPFSSSSSTTSWKLCLCSGTNIWGILDKESRLSLLEKTAHKIWHFTFSLTLFFCHGHFKNKEC